MTLVGIPKEDQNAIFAASASVLHLGNITFSEGPEESSHVTDASAEFHLNAAASLLGVDAKGLAKALTTRTRQTFDGADLLHDPYDSQSIWYKQSTFQLT